MSAQNNNGAKDPWGSGQQSPPDLDAIINKGIKNLKDKFSGGGSGGKGGGAAGFGRALPIILLFAAGLSLWSAYYTVPSDSVAVVQRFGMYLKEVPPGLHFKLPLGIDKSTVVPVKRQLKQEFGFSTPGARDAYQGSRDGNLETQMVTGDLNAALVEWVVQYRISDPVKFLFAVREPAETLRYVSESVMREVVGDRTVDEVITIGRQEIEIEALLKMQELSSKYEMGINIDQVQLKNINPPRPVQESFNEVNQAQQEKEKLINEARREYNKVIPLAEGEKDQRIREADGYRLKRINEAEGDVARFNALFTEYRKAPEVTRRRIYIETMQEIMPNIQNKILVDDDMSGLLPLLNIGEQKGSKK
ncbi:membrane protease subunit HflK [Zhongshania antarctica]|jgi:membrane protease subunit HflK|uniref:Protein HflK n=1 Tax=Zhongshania antarctica TaxID=641702 RepID=A0A840R5U3_9GAMM|nr:FtsH protease activity modulator HflK [Zhongshania antarctica]MBB5187876.1 membrane protease subunit HflK [Zhongshania antarctica]